MNAIPLPARLLMSAAALALGTACSSSPSADTTAPDAGAAGPPASSAPATPAPSSPADKPTESAAAPVITIVDFEYAVPAAVPAGAKVLVTNRDSEAHTVTVQGGGDAKVVVQGGETATFTAPAQAGTYPIVCDFHGNMQAELVVR